MKISSSTERSLGFRKRLLNWISGRNWDSPESKSAFSDEDEYRSSADKVAKEKGLGPMLRILLLLLSLLPIQLNGHLIGLYVNPLSV
jgi:hypothetical protein